MSRQLRIMQDGEIDRLWVRLRQRETMHGDKKTVGPKKMSYMS